MRPPLQAADLLAWLWRNAVMKAMKDEPERKDLTALRRKLSIETFRLGSQYLRAEKSLINGLLRCAGVMGG